MLRLIFVAAIDYENIFAMKISRFMVHVPLVLLYSKTVNDRSLIKLVTWTSALVFSSISTLTSFQEIYIDLQEEQN